MKCLSVLFLIFHLNLIICEQEREQGVTLILDSVKTLVYGEPAEHSFKDLFMDTSKDLLTIVEKANDQLTIDDMLRIMIQSILILIANRRSDLIPVDFIERHAEYGKVISELNKLLSILEKKGTSQVTLAEFRPLIKSLNTDNFWKSLLSLRSEVAELIQQESHQLNQEL